MVSSETLRHSKFGTISIICGTISFVSWGITLAGYSLISSLIRDLSEEGFIMFYGILGLLLVASPILGLFYGIKGIMQNNKNKSLCILGIITTSITVIFLVLSILFGLLSKFG